MAITMIGIVIVIEIPVVIITHLESVFLFLVKKKKNSAHQGQKKKFWIYEIENYFSQMALEVLFKIRTF